MDVTVYTLNSEGECDSAPCSDNLSAVPTDHKYLSLYVEG